LQGTEVLLHNGDDTRSSPHPSVVALGCLNERDERGRRTGSLLELTQSKTRDGSRNKNRMKEMKCGPQQSAAN